MALALALASGAAANVDLTSLRAPDPATPPTAAAPGPSSLQVVGPLPSSASTPPTPAFTDGELIVRFRHWASASTRIQAHRAAVAVVKRRMLLPDTYLVRFNRHKDPLEVARIYRRQAGVRYAEPNFIRTYDSTLANDPALGELWGYHNRGQVVNGFAGTAGADIHAPEAWDVTQGSTSVVVGVVDTGIDYNHSDLAPNIWTNAADPPGGGDQDSNGLIDDYHGYNFLDGPTNPDPIDDVGHGSHVAGIIAAAGNNSTGVTGVSWRSKIAALRACDAVGCDDAAIADAFTYAGIKGFRVVNASLSSPNNPTTPGPLYSNTIAAAITAYPNTLFVVAAGNGGGDEVGDNVETTPAYPCSYTSANLVCVAATDANDNLALFSDYGSTSVDLAAPGQYILSTWKRNGGQDQYAYESGTSQATAMVSGSVALDLSKTPGATAPTLRNDLLVHTVAKPQLSGKVVTGGRLDVGNMIPVQSPSTDPTGALDTSFSGDGKQTLNFSSPCKEQSEAAAIQPDGKIVMVGQFCLTSASNRDYGIARIGTDGNLDPSFSGDGLASFDLNAQDGDTHAVALQSDGKILVAGSYWDGTGTGSGVEWALTRLNSNGTVDTTFGSSGSTIMHFATGPSPWVEYPTAIAVQSDGKSVVVGRDPADFAVARFNTNGTLDTTFSGDGKVLTSIGGPSDTYSPDDTANAVAIQSNGKIVVAGGTNFSGSSASVVQDWALARYNTDGSLDTTFDADGKLTTDFGGQHQSTRGEQAYGLKIQSDGKIVAVGLVPANGATPVRYGVARYNLDGSLDASFGSGGKVTTPVTGSGNFTPAEPHGVTVDSSGRVIISGWAQNPSSGQSSFTVMRYSSSGTLDSTFGTGGVQYTDFALGGRANVVALDAVGRIVALGDTEAGSTGATKFAIARYGTAPVLRVDPNTEVNPTGTQPVINGWGFPPNATLSLQQCNGTTCAALGSPSTDFTGHFTVNSATVSYALPGGSCPLTSCKIVASGTGFTPAQAPISFAASTSIVVTPSRGGIYQNDAIKVGDVITARADLNGGAGGAPTGSVSFFWCGPVVSPATCAAGGTGLGTPALTASGGATAFATSSSVSFGAPGRYCFRAVYAADGLHRPASDSSKAACVAVRAAPGTGPLALDDFYSGASGNTIADGSPGLMQNDIFAIGSVPTAQLVTGPSQGTLSGGLNADGSFTYIPNNGSVTSDSFTYRVQDTSGTSAPATVSIDLTGTAATEGTRYRGTRYQGTRYRGTRYRGTRYRGTRYRSLFDATLTTYAECGPRWVWLNPEITVFEQTYLEVSAALYDAAGKRIASTNGFIAQGDFFGDLGEPLAINWPVWNAPVPAGGVYAQVFVSAVPADPTQAPYEINSNVVGCQT
jgi:uncharacterized delta-60 repeat protein